MLGTEFESELGPQLLFLGLYVWGFFLHFHRLYFQELSIELFAAVSVVVSVQCYLADYPCIFLYSACTAVSLEALRSFRWVATARIS